MKTKRQRLGLVVATLLVLILSGCDNGSTNDSDPNDSGLGMTYNGKLGIDYGNGFVQPLDGSAPGLGYGF